MPESVPTYEQLFDRNIGVLTLEQQARVRSLTVAIAGCGGLGAPCASMLARMGVGELRLADPEVFEASNVNRQWGAYPDTLGMNKATVTAAEVSRITPYTRTHVLPDGVTSENVDEFLDGADVVIDATEFFAFEVQMVIHSAARERELWVFTDQQAVEILTLFAFDPSGVGLVDAVHGLSGPSLIERATEIYFPVLPAATTPEILDELVSGNGVSIGSWSTSPSLGGALVTSELIGHTILGRQPAAVFPDIMVLDTDRLHFELIRRNVLPDGSVISSE